MNEPHELTPEQIIEDEQAPQVLTVDEILDEVDDADGAVDDPRPREDWQWLDKEKLDRKEIVAAQSRS